MKNIGWRVAPFALLLILAVPGIAAAAEDVPAPQPGLTLPSIQFWSAVIGALVPLVTYVVNYHAPWLDEKVKALVLVVTAAIAGALYQLIQAGDLELDTETLQVVLTAVVSAVLTHTQLWTRSGISTSLGGGRNRQQSGVNLPGEAGQANLTGLGVVLLLIGLVLWLLVNGPLGWLLIVIGLILLVIGLVAGSRV